MRSSREATRSLMPSRSTPPADSCSSVTAAARNCPTSPLGVGDALGALGGRARARERRERAAHAPLGGRRARCVLASQTVQVTTEAKASPIITAFTTMSALRNMPQGERSRGSMAVPMTGGGSGAGTGASGSCAQAAPAISSGAAEASRMAAGHARAHTLNKHLLTCRPCRISPRLTARHPTSRQCPECDVIM